MKELVVFDLDGTLLNRDSRISDHTGATLRLLSQRGIAYTIATGRTLHGSRAVTEGHRFDWPQAFKNGVMIWYPEQQHLSSSTTLSAGELAHVIQACLDRSITPFVFTLDTHHSNTVYHPATESAADEELIRNLGIEGRVIRHPLDALPADATVTHINSIGDPGAIQEVVEQVANEPQLIAYSGLAREGSDWFWLDVHHHAASKGNAIETLKEQLGFERIICFGDSDNDLSLFETADECYAPANANPTIKRAATAVIGHHDEDGVARFLHQRFDLTGG